MFMTVIWMILRGTFALVGVLVLTACVQHVRNSGNDPVPPVQTDSLRFATYNVHYIILRKETGPWSTADWSRRKGPMDQAFKTLNADIVTFQEMESFQRGDPGYTNLARDHLLAQNPDYTAGANGDPLTFPPTQPIFFRKDRLTLLDQGWFFFSDTPDVIYSRTFNGSFPAFASWVQLQDAGGNSFRVVNVHFEFKSRSNRQKSAALVIERTADWIASGETVFLLGDLNARLGAKTVEMFQNAGFVFSPIQGSTYHLNRGVNLFGAIDHIAVAGPVGPAGDPVVLRQKFDGHWPSDHYPVLRDYQLRP